MYSLAALADLAADVTFRRDVRDLGQRLMVHPATTNRAWVQTLTVYGPRHPGVALRLLHLGHAVHLNTLDRPTAELWASLLPPIEAAHADV